MKYAPLKTTGSYNNQRVLQLRHRHQSNQEECRVDKCQYRGSPANKSLLKHWPALSAVPPKFTAEAPAKLVPGMVIVLDIQVVAGVNEEIVGDGSNVLKLISCP